jgi:hypothetical protein
MPESASNPAAAPEYHPMRVGEGIDRLMMPYTFQKSLWHGGSPTASNHIREKMSYTEFYIGRGEERVS